MTTRIQKLSTETWKCSCGVLISAATEQLMGDISLCSECADKLYAEYEAACVAADKRNSNLSRPTNLTTTR